MAINPNGQTVFSLSHIEGITKGAGEEVDEVAGGVSGMGVDRIGEVGDQARRAGCRCGGGINCWMNMWYECGYYS